MLSTPMCIKTAYIIQSWYIITLELYKYRPRIVPSAECRNFRNFILRLQSELKVFNLGGSAFQVEDPEKSKACLKQVNTSARENVDI